VDQGGPDGELDPRVERSRRRVREAALVELAQKGYGAFTIDAVSARCGVARSTIYRHWPDKLALVADAFETLNRQPPPAGVAEPETARQRICRLVHHLAEVLAGSIFSDCLPALIEGAERHPDVRQFFHGFNDRRRAALTDAVARGVASGEVSGRIDPDLAATALAGAVLYRRLMTDSRLAPERAAELVDLVLGPRPD
jgi:TetR/AcrR family transcriptional regulator of autoinduction and epiphytic fitness